MCLGGGQCGGRGLSRSAFGRRAEPSNRMRREAEGRTVPDRDDAAPAGALGKRGGTLIGTRLPSALDVAGIGMLGVGGRSGSAESSCISTCHGPMRCASNGWAAARASGRHTPWCTCITSRHRPTAIAPFGYSAGWPSRRRWLSVSPAGQRSRAPRPAGSAGVSVRIKTFVKAYVKA